MSKAIEYEFLCLEEAVKDIQKLKEKLPVRNGKSRNTNWDNLNTGKSKGDTYNALSELLCLTEQRSRQIEMLLNNVQTFLTLAKDEMKAVDDSLGRGM